MPVCTRCGTIVANGWVGPCPECHASEFADEYASSIAVSTSASTYSALDALIYARGMLESVAQSPEKAAFVKPIIKQLDIAVDVTKKQETKLASAQNSDFEDFEGKIKEYEKLVERNADEPEFQNFFEVNPAFLDPKMRDCRPKKSFGGEGFPDFLLTLHDSSYVIVEIEKPSIRLFTNSGDPHT